MKKGFTLIELLAVIVILAILALITIPVVIEIVEDGEKNTLLQSAQMYLNGIEKTVMEEKMNNGVTFTERECNITKNTLSCDEISPITMDIEGGMPEKGNIKLENGKVVAARLVYSGKPIMLTAEGNLVFEKERTLDDICKYDTSSTVAERKAGAKYICEVKKGTSYNFYVLTTPPKGDNFINLIMERNIYYNSTTGYSGVADSENTALVAWNTSGANIDGPVTAMDYLYKATREWSNIPNIEMNYKDEGNTTSYGYGTIVTTDDVTKITKKDSTPIIVLTDQEGYINLKARLPYSSEIKSYTTTSKQYAYLYDYLSSNDLPNKIEGIYAYWTFSTYSSKYAYSATANGNLSDTSVSNQYGIRPVISLRI